MGVGCVRGSTADEVEKLILTTLEQNGLAFESVRELATIDLKRDEDGLTELAARHNWPVRYFSTAELAMSETPSGPSIDALRAVGVPGVCEPAALLAAGVNALLVPKVKTSRVTVAIARVGSETRPGLLTIVGLGPGAADDLTARGRRALEAAEAVVGYAGYLDLVRPWLGVKQYFGSPIGDETERCRLALSLARSGRRVALVSSGDAGVYGMAGLVFELLGKSEKTSDAEWIEVVPGVSAAQAAAALVGAPLMSDFAVISLSDLLIPWPIIEQRLEAVGAGDLVVALYNPASDRRRQQLERAREILLRHRAPETPVALVRNASRAGQTIVLTDLGRLLDHTVDMLTIVLIGNSATEWIGHRMVTRRGYRRAPVSELQQRGSHG